MTAQNNFQQPTWNSILTTLDQALDQELPTETREALIDNAENDEPLPPVPTQLTCPDFFPPKNVPIPMEPGTILIYPHRPRLVIDAPCDDMIVFDLINCQYSLRRDEWVSVDYIDEQALTHGLMLF